MASDVLDADRAVAVRVAEDASVHDTSSKAASGVLDSSVLNETLLVAVPAASLSGGGRNR